MIGEQWIYRNGYKAVAPEETVRTIRDILFALQLFVIEFKWVREDECFTLLGLGMVDLPVRTAGKGINERYALASAYGEFIERLQNLLLINGNLRSGKHPRKDVLFSDSVPFDYHSFKISNPDILEHLFTVPCLSELDEVISRCGVSLHSYPYYNVTTGRRDYLPYELMLLSVGSNGMCSGNTNEEALVQGLCEIFERHVFRKIYQTGITCPDVPDEYMRHLPQWHYIDVLRDQGFEVVVKDCSFGGQLPVAGVLVLRDGKAQFNLGASPDFSIAVERCFTEMFQGCDIRSINNKLREIASLDAATTDRALSTPQSRVQHEYFRSLISATGTVHPALFDHSLPFDPKMLFHSDDVITKGCLRRMLEIVHNAGYQTYIRDVGFLGFPTFHVYVPGMSEVMTRTPDELRLQLCDIPRARTIFYNLESCSDDEIMELIQTIERLREYPYADKEALCEVLHNLRLTGHYTLSNLDLENILVLLYCRKGDYAAAHRVMESYVRSKLSAEQFHNPPAFARDHVCLVQVLRLLAEGNSLKVAEDTLVHRFGRKTVGEICSSLADMSQMSRYFGIPVCEDCDRCEYRGGCSYVPGRRIADRVQAQINENPFDHTAIGEHLQRLL